MEEHLQMCHIQTHEEPLEPPEKEDSLVQDPTTSLGISHDVTSIRFQMHKKLLNHP